MNKRFWERYVRKTKPKPRRVAWWRIPLAPLAVPYVLGRWNEERKYTDNEILCIRQEKTKKF